MLLNQKLTKQRFQVKLTTTINEEKLIYNSVLPNAYIRPIQGYSPVGKQNVSSSVVKFDHFCYFNYENVRKERLVIEI